MNEDQNTPEVTQEENNSDMQEVSTEETPVEVDKWKEAYAKESGVEVDVLPDDADYRSEFFKLKKTERIKMDNATTDKPERPLQDISLSNLIAVEEAHLRIDKVSDEEIAMLRRVAKMNNSSLAEAREDPIYTTWKTREDEAREIRKAQIGASKSTSGAHDTSVNAPGISAKERLRRVRAEIARRSA